MISTVLYDIMCRMVNELISFSLCTLKGIQKIKNNFVFIIIIIYLFVIVVGYPRLIAIQIRYPAALIICNNKASYVRSIPISD